MSCRIISKTTIKEIKKEVLNIVVGKQIYICGAGVLGEVFAKWLDNCGIKWVAVIDRRGQADWTQKPVYKYDYLKHLDYSRCVFVVTQKFFKEEVIGNLESVGVAEENIVAFYDDLTFDEFYYDTIPKSNKMVLSKFRNMYKGERCFVIGNGPSLRENDLQALEKNRECYFAVNMLHESFDRLNLHPTGYFVGDRLMSKEFEKSKTRLRELLDRVDLAFFEIKTGIYNQYYKDTPDNLYFYKNIRPRYNTLEEGSTLFSDDVTKGVYSLGTVLTDVLQFVVYMGFERIYLIGVDFTYKLEQYNGNKRVVNKSIETNHAKFLRDPGNYCDDAFEMVDVMHTGYMAAKKYADSHNIKIFNATRGGRLEIFPRVEADSLLGLNM